jgi:hypothetical protein
MMEEINLKDSLNRVCFLQGLPLDLINDIHCIIKLNSKNNVMSQGLAKHGSEIKGAFYFMNLKERLGAFLQRLVSYTIYSSNFADICHKDIAPM